MPDLMYAHTSKEGQLRILCYVIDTRAEQLDEEDITDDALKAWEIWRECD
jgi:hypothetical protein